MKKSWVIETLLGLVVTLAVVGSFFLRLPFTESLESRLYDLRLKYAPKAPLSDQILLVSIDDASIASVGRWPWPRGVVGQLIREIALGGPRVIGVNILYVDPDQNQGLEVVRQIKAEYEGLIDAQKEAWGGLFMRVNRDPKYKTFTRDNPLSLDPFRSVVDLLGEAEQALDNDAQLAMALADTPGVVLPAFFSIDRPLAEESDEALARMKGYYLPKVETALPSGILEGHQPLLPLPAFSSATSGLGHSNIFADADGVVRQETLLVKYKDHYFPSLSLEMARVASGLNPDDIMVRLGKEVLLGPKRIPLNEENRVFVNYQGTFSSLKTISAIDVLAEKVQPAAFKDKIVLLGTMATGIGTLFVVPVEPAFPANGVIVTVLQNILGENFITRPDWAFWFEVGSLALVGLFVVLLLPHLKAKWGAIIAAVLFLGVAGTGVYFFMTQAYWLKIFYGMALVVLGYTAITIRRFFFTERRKELVEAESIETNKMLGLSFQGQGMLDLAFEKFRKCPIDDAMKELLYNLALDFERKRQFNKAAVVYGHISTADAGYKDIADRLKTCKAAAEGGVVTSLGGGGKKEGTIVMEGAAVKPTLGRYEIEKELGRGAMGIVYLGKDPKINRQVAIKTLKFDDDVDEATAKAVKERFFREAESAGTLNHPSIVRIFDAGEDNEICYIAMELLSGEDLKKYGEKANLLPPEQAVEYVAQVADALDYAHSNGIVHRDIKPANIMRLKDGTLRVTDFGIARITASSKTQTGTVMGTPSYMSPEQIAGKKVDGRADLFSLGVMLYELMTGEKPFEGDSIATLLFRISSEPHPDPVLKSAERVSPAIRAVIDKALQKNPDNRYQRGKDMATDLREALKNPNAPPANAGSPGAPAPSAAPLAGGGETVRLAAPPTSSASPFPSGGNGGQTPAPPPADTVRVPPSTPPVGDGMAQTPAPPPGAADTVRIPPQAQPTDTVRIEPQSPKSSGPDETLKIS
jgi:eukaryotic-like serine/threonine-protein kinase